MKPEMTLYIPEILELISNENSRNKKKELLIKYRKVKGFGKILQMAYQEDMKCKFSNQEINELLERKHDKSYGDYGQTLSTLFMEYNKIYLFFEGSPMIKPNKLENMFIQLREVLHPNEFDVVVKILRRENLAKGLTEKLIRETFPNMLK